MQPLPQAQAYLRGRFKHIIADNIEEDTPASHAALGFAYGALQFGADAV